MGLQVACETVLRWERVGIIQSVCKDLERTRHYKKSDLNDLLEFRGNRPRINLIKYMREKNAKKNI